MTTSTQPTATAPLVRDLRGLALELERDFAVRAREEPFATRLKGEYDEARVRERIAIGYAEWLAGRVTQAAAAWVLATVFVRYCEDNDLIERPFLSGPGDRRTLAEEYQNQFFTQLPTLNNRDYLIAAFTHVAEAHPAAAGLFDERVNPANALWDITPSYEAANRLIGFWRDRDETGGTRYDVTGWDTRFLGDLYQDLSEAARKTYALRQTPEFVEESILDLTLRPAIEEFGLDGLRTIDPASGSGHFLLGLFRRILAAWRAAEPGTEDWTLIRRSMASVHGCDKNPFASAIARFRLLVAALDEAGVSRLDQASDFPINVAVGDSLLHGRGVVGRQEEINYEGAPHSYSTEDVNHFVATCDLLGRSSYHVVVANPPYITVRDATEKAQYKSRYDACQGLWVLSIPFAQRIFQLAVRGGPEKSAGYAGQITANSYMKREFGRGFVERFIPTVQLTHVIDTSGAFIPGHTTPTVILIGRNWAGSRSEKVRTLVGLRGEPGKPADAANGKVWQEIAKNATGTIAKSSWVAVEFSGRERFESYPWALGVAARGSLIADLEQGRKQLRKVVSDIGYTGQTNADDAFLAPSHAFVRRGVVDVVRKFLTGDDLRDYCASPRESSVFPYGDTGDLLNVEEAPSLVKWMYPVRTVLGNRTTFARNTYFVDGRPWWSWHQVARGRLSGPVLTWPMVQTHQHFVYLRNCALHNRHAPMMMLASGESEAEHLALLGVLNSSAACFWMKEVCHDKGSQSGTGGFMRDEWERFYEFTSTKLQNFPLPADLPLDLGREIDRLAHRLAEQEASAVCARQTPTRTMLDAARARHEGIQKQMIALQEELDWEVYQAYGLVTGSEAKALRSELPEPLNLGERAFEIVLARLSKTGETETAWFERHQSMPTTDLPTHWSEEYRAVVEARIGTIERRTDLALIERPECKRRWAGDRWEKSERAALEAWLLDRCEEPELWFGQRDGFRQPRTLTVSQLADRFPPDSDVHAVAALYATDHLDQRDMILAEVLEAVVADEHVPYLAAMRYQPSGLEKRAEWERTWEGQREEDRLGKSLNLAVPPEYKATDFRKTSFWSQRGKLDVPKERFVSYPGASPDADPTLLLGWAGWDHKDQAQAIINLVNDRTTQAGWDTERITPLLAGLAELMPWVEQWHGEFDPEWEGTPAEEYQAFLDAQRAERGLTDEALRGWRPLAVRPGRQAGGST